MDAFYDVLSFEKPPDIETLVCCQSGFSQVPKTTHQNKKTSAHRPCHEEILCFSASTYVGSGISGLRINYAVDLADLISSPKDWPHI